MEKNRIHSISTFKVERTNFIDDCQVGMDKWNYRK